MNFSDIKIGMKQEKEYRIINDLYQGFLKAFGDNNKLHVNDEYAQSKGFKSKVMHGSIINGLISHFIGTQFPAGETVLQSVDIEYKKPNYLDDKIKIEAMVEQISEAVEVVVLKVTVHNMTQDTICAKARIQMGTLKDKNT